MSSSKKNSHPQRVAVVMTCHNRKRSTISSLRSLFSTVPHSFQLSVFLVDDGSTDGTSQEVSTSFPSVHLIRGDGKLFWNRGMHLAFQHAMKTGADYYLWLNDDVQLFCDAFTTVFYRVKELEKHVASRYILVGATCDPHSGEFTYGGVNIKPGIRKFKYISVPPRETLTLCDTFNGNFVFIPKSVACELGNLDPRFQHALGDFDYGLRAKSRKIPLYVLDQYVGSCLYNHSASSWQDSDMKLIKRMHLKESPKGLPFWDWYWFCNKHGGGTWLVWVVSPYAKMVLQSVRKKRRTMS